MNKIFNKTTFLYLISLVSILLIISFNINNLGFFQTKNNETISKNSYSYRLWGSNKFSQLGLKNNFNDKITFKDKNTIGIEGIENIEESTVVTGYNHSTILDKNGRLYSFGDNRSGQIGAGTRLVSYDKVTKNQLLTSVNSISANQHHTLAITKTGDVYGWGLNLSNQLGQVIPNFEFSTSPVKINFPKNIVSVNAGYRTSFAITDTGDLWGVGGSCQQSDADKLKATIDLIGKSATLTGTYYDKLGATADEPINYTDCVPQSEVNMNLLAKTPKKIEGLSNVKLVSSGYGHFMAISNDFVYSWGCNLYGQLGNGNNENNLNSQKPTIIPNLTNIAQVSSGFRHSLALSNNGEVFAWGHNGLGELGLGELELILTPTKLNNIPKMKQVIASHDYSLAVDIDGNLWGWGENKYGQLSSDKSITKLSKPTQLTNDTNILRADSKGSFIAILGKNK